MAYGNINHYQTQERHGLRDRTTSKVGNFHEQRPITPEDMGGYR